MTVEIRQAGATISEIAGLQAGFVQQQVETMAEQSKAFFEFSSKFAQQMFELGPSLRPYQKMTWRWPRRRERTSLRFVCRSPERQPPLAPSSSCSLLRTQSP